MIFSIIGLFLGIVIPSFWIFIPYKKSSLENKFSVWIYIRTILIGATLCSLCIMIPEVCFDKLTGIDTHGVENLREVFLAAFLRAALIEETIKFVFVKLALKKHKPNDKLQYMLLAASVGMGYGITEKLGYGSAAVLISALFAFHIIFQFIMGAYLYEADRTKDKKQRKITTFKAFIIPYTIHGLWDMALNCAGLYIENDSMLVFLIILLILIAILISGVTLEVKMYKYLKNLVVAEL